MKKIFLFLVAIVFVLVGYGFSEARKIEAKCSVSIDESNSTIIFQFIGIKDFDLRSILKDKQFNKLKKIIFPVTLELKTKKGKFKEFNFKGAYSITPKSLSPLGAHYHTSFDKVALKINLLHYLVLIQKRNVSQICRFPVQSLQVQTKPLYPLAVETNFCSRSRNSLTV
ncbi:MAG: hypothetical protein ACJZ47_00475 [bacterium]